MQVKEITPRDGFERSFEIIVQQPVDHNNPNGQQFNQRLYLHHLSDKAPMVFYPSGYAAHPQRLYDLENKLEANLICATHRYVSDARPYPTDWQYLTIEQAVADHHEIVEIFKSYYKKQWLSMGRSKSGMTALFHRRFYPDDVDATIAWVSPMIHGVDDARFDNYLEKVGSTECRNRIITFQRTILEKKDEILPLIQSYMDQSSLTYNVEPEIILEYEVCEYPFAYWQFYEMWPCESIPDENASAAVLYQHLKNLGGFQIYSDEYRDYYSPLYYMAYNELGWYKLKKDYLSDLLTTNPSYSFFVPENINLIFKPEVMQDIENWLQNEGNNIIYIYGENDTWTAGAIELTGATNAIKIVQPNANHNVMIDDLDNPDLVYNALEEWLGVEIY